MIAEGFKNTPCEEEIGGGEEEDDDEEEEEGKGVFLVKL